LKQLNFKIVGIIILLMLAAGVKTFGQVSQNSDSARYKKFLPDYVKIQFAGGIGFVSMGVGYTFFNQKLEVSYLYGYVPESVSTDDLHSVSLQLTAKLLRFKICLRLQEFL